MPDLNVQDLVQDNQPIYVYNRTGQYLPQQGTYVLEIKDGNDRPVSVVIPATKYPFLLSAHVPAKLLADSPTFYSVLANGVLELVDPEEAQTIMRSPMAQQVQEQAMRKFQPVRRSAKKPGDLMQTKRHGPENVRQPNNTPLVVAAETRGEDAAQQGVNASVLQIAMDLQSDPSLHEEKFLELAGMEDLQDLDFGYLLQHCKDFPKILQFARKELASLVDDEEDAKETPKPKTSKRGRKARGKKN